MGLCFPCPGESAPPSPNLEEKRAKLAEAAERRQKEAASRGILNVQSVEEKRKKKEKIEKQIATSGAPPEGGLRVIVHRDTGRTGVSVTRAPPNVAVGALDTGNIMWTVS